MRGALSGASSGHQRARRPTTPVDSSPKRTLLCPHSELSRARPISGHNRRIEEKGPADTSIRRKCSTTPRCWLVWHALLRVRQICSPRCSHYINVLYNVPTHAGTMSGRAAKKRRLPTSSESVRPLPVKKGTRFREGASGSDSSLCYGQPEDPPSKEGVSQLLPVVESLSWSIREEHHGELLLSASFQ